jgi:hypothetical protein
MKILFAILTCFIVYVNAYAQIDRDFNIFDLRTNHLNFELSSGFNRGLAEIDSGNIAPRSKYLPLPKFRASYLFNISKRFGCETGLGVGLLPYNFYVPEIGDIFFAYGLDYLLFGEASLRMHYRLQQKGKYTPGFSLGLSTVSMQEVSFSYTSSSPSYEARYVNFVENQRRMMLNAGFGLSKLLPNLDLLNFRIEYNYGLNELYRGNYQLKVDDQKVARGDIFNPGHHVALAVSYSFTKAAKVLQKVQQSGYEPENERILKGFKKWDHDSARTKISFQMGLSSQQMRISDPSNRFYDYNFLVPFPVIALDYHFNKHNFIETALGLQEFYTSYAEKGNSWFQSESENTTVHWMTGMGRTFYLKNKKRPLIHISSGLSLNFNDMTNGESFQQASSFQDSLMPPLNYDFYYKERRFNISLYAALARDFQLTDALALNFTYRIHQGLWQTYENKRFYNQAPPEENREVSFRSLGSFRALSMGLKIDLGRLQPKPKQQIIAKGDISIVAHAGSLGLRSRIQDMSIAGKERNNYTEPYGGFMSGMQVNYQLRPPWGIDASLNYLSVNGYYGEQFTMGQITAGLNRQIKTYSGIHLIDLHAGTGIGSIIQYSGISGTTMFQYSNPDEYQYSESQFSKETGVGTTFSYRILGQDTISFGYSEIRFNKQPLPLLYLQASKEFRVVKQFYLGMAFRKQFGLRQFFSAIYVSGADNKLESISAERLRGNANSMLFYLKYKL